MYLSASVGELDTRRVSVPAWNRGHEVLSGGVNGQRLRLMSHWYARSAVWWGVTGIATFSGPKMPKISVPLLPVRMHAVVKARLNNLPLQTQVFVINMAAYGI